MDDHFIMRLVLAAVLPSLGCAYGIPVEGFPADAAVDTADVFPDTGVDAAGDSIVDTVVDDGGALDTSSDTSRDDGGEDVADVEDEGDGATGPCDTNLGTFSPGETATVWDGTYGEYWDVLGSISASLFTSPVSLVAVQSNMGLGGPVTPGTYTITSFVSPTTCTVCIFAMEDCDVTTGMCTRMYAADSATLEITALEGRGGGRISGTLYNAHLLEVEQLTGALVPGGRTLCLDAWTFSELFVAM